MATSPLSLSTAVIEEHAIYIAIKGSLYASDCSVFGLQEDEINALTKKYPGSSGDVLNGVTMKTNVLAVLNSLSQLGYKVISSTGETEITWTLVREE